MTGVRLGETDAAAILRRSPQRKSRLHAGGGGLYLQVTASKNGDSLNRTWIFAYARNKRERQMGLGSLNAIGLSQEREEAARWRGVERAAQKEQIGFP